MWTGGDGDSNSGNLGFDNDSLDEDLLKGFFTDSSSQEGFEMTSFSSASSDLPSTPQPGSSSTGESFPTLDVPADNETGPTPLAIAVPRSAEPMEPIHPPPQSPSTMVPELRESEQLRGGDLDRQRVRERATKRFKPIGGLESRLAAVNLPLQHDVRWRYHADTSLPFIDALQFLTIVNGREEPVGSGISEASQRPAHFTASDIDSAPGTIFIGPGRRRRKGTDKWVCKGGSHGTQKWHVPDGCGEHSGKYIERKYGSVELLHESIDQSAKFSLNYHQYSLQGESIVIYHVLNKPKRLKKLKGQQHHKAAHVHANQSQRSGDHITEKLMRTKSGAGETDDCTLRSLDGVQRDATNQLIRGTQRFQLCDDVSEDMQHHWLQFEDSRGIVKGTLSQGNKGVTLISSSGDFAEWRLRAPDDEPFEEGDVVGIWEYGLSRLTDDAPQVGIISRWAVVAGGAPAASERHKYDMVAYAGHVPVKLRGSFEPSAIVAPSGRNDGTAVAVSTIGCCRTEVRLGRVRDAKNDVCDGNWRLVPVDVVSPVETVRRSGLLFPPPCRLQRKPRRSQIVVGIFLALTILFIASHSTHGQKQVCQRVELAHGVVRGDCSGSIGAQCSYDSCDPGYVLVGPTYPKGMRHLANNSIPTYPICTHCYGDGLFCEQLGQNESSAQCVKCASKNSQWVCTVGGSNATCGQHGNGTICAGLLDPPCSVCSVAAIDSGWHACELSSTPWGRAPSDGDSIRRSAIADWYSPSKVKCLSEFSLETSVSCDMFGGYATCPFHTVSNCSTQAQMQFLAGHDGGKHGDWQIRKCTLRPRPVTKDIANTRRFLAASSPIDHLNTSVIRTCVKPGGPYNGDNLECEPSQHWSSCPAENVSALQAGVCLECENTDAVLSFPSGTLSEVYNLSCPATHEGTLQRVCEPSGWSGIKGNCRRLRCPPISIDLWPQFWSFLNKSDFFEGIQSIDKWAPKRFQEEQRFAYGQLVFDEGNLGDEMTVNCPQMASLARRGRVNGDGFNWPYAYAGSITRTCEKVSNSARPEWSTARGECKVMMCPAGRHPVQVFHNGIAINYTMILPAASARSPPISTHIDCCQAITSAGGCGEAGAAIGQVAVECGADGLWQSKATEGSYCFPPNTDADTVRLESSSNASTVSLYRQFVDRYGATLVSVTRGWALPAEGVLGTVSFRFKDDWKPLATQVRSGATQKTGYWVLDSTRRESSSWMTAGRSAAAAANVSCRQLGYTKAVAVMPCTGLILMEASGPTPIVQCVAWSQGPKGDWLCGQWVDISNRSLAKLLCPAAFESKQHCKSWLTIRADTDDPTTYMLPRAPGVVVTEEGPKSSASPDLSSCIGDEAQIEQCFRAQLGGLYLGDNVPGMFKAKPKSVECGHLLLIACASEPSEPDSFVDGIWTIGDRLAGQPKCCSNGYVDSVNSCADEIGERNCSQQAVNMTLEHSASLSEPKIFTSTAPHSCDVHTDFGPTSPNLAITAKRCKWGHLYPSANKSRA